MAWPKKVPILSADDICRGVYHGDNGTHCLRGWCMVTFPGCNEFLEAGQKIAEEVRVTSNADVVQFNDNPDYGAGEIASVWNRAMRKLGYTVPCER